LAGAQCGDVERHSHDRGFQRAREKNVRRRKVDKKLYPFGLGRGFSKADHGKPIDFTVISKLLTRWKKRGKTWVEVPSTCMLLRYYPYSKKTTYHGGLYGKVDLLRPPARWFTKQRSKMALIADILGEVGRAMRYVVVSNNDIMFANQAVWAFSMWQLLEGDIYRFNVRQLRAIAVQVRDAFENMC